MEPTTGLVIDEEKFLVACPVCHELLERRERKKQQEKRKKAMEADLKKAQKQATRAPAPPAAKPAKAKPEPPSWNDVVPQENKGQKAAAKPKPKAKAPAGASASAQQSEPMQEAFVPPAAAAPPPPMFMMPQLPPPNPRYEAAEKAIAALFQKMRVEELPLQTVRATTDLSETEMEELLQQMDDNNKVMCRQGQVYII